MKNTRIENKSLLTVSKSRIRVIDNWFLRILNKLMLVIEGIMDALELKIDETKEQRKEIPDEEILKQEKTQSSVSKKTLKSKKIITLIIVDCILIITLISIVIGISKGFKSGKEKKSVQSYIDRMAPVVDGKLNNFDHCLSNAKMEGYYDYVSNSITQKTKAEKSRDVRKAVVAGFDALEAYLDFYKGLVSVKGKGNYSGTNELIEKTITDVEQCYTTYEDFIPAGSLSEYKNRMLQIRTEWRSIKQNY